MSGQTLVECEASKAHDCALRMAHIEQLLLTSDLQHIVQHGWEVDLGMLIKSVCDSILGCNIEN